jgi:hypothetical protein
MKKKLMDKARSMLNGVGITQELWVEAVDTKKYLLNMSPSSVLIDMTPHEVWSSKNPLVSYLKLFGCDTFVHVPKEKRSKLDKNKVKCIFIGYKEGMEGCNLWDHASRIFFYNQYVVFREVRRKFEPEGMVQTKDNPEKVWFEMRNEEDDLYESTKVEEEAEQPIPVVRRSE